MAPAWDILYRMSHQSPWPRLLLVSVLLPATVVAADSLALSHAQSQSWSTEATLVVFGLFLAQVALLAHLAGRCLPNWPWRLLVLGWSAVVVDLLLYSVSSYAQPHGLLLVCGFYASQIALSVSWAVLGSATWRWRLPLAALLLAAATYLIFRVPTQQSEGWLSVVFVQTLGTLGLCSLLRAFGYRIEPVAATTATAAGGPLQFSIGHMLIWTTAAAMIVMAAKQVVLSSAVGHDWEGWLQIAIEGVILAVVALAAMWLALGGGRVWLTALVALVLAGAAGTALWHLEARYFASRMKGVIWYEWKWIPYAGWWWVAWTLLAGSFLAGMLLAFRATGHRLVRRLRMLA